MFLLLCISKWVLQSDLISKREFKTIGLVQVLWDTTCLVRLFFSVWMLCCIGCTRKASPQSESSCGAAGHQIRGNIQSYNRHYFESSTTLWVKVRNISKKTNELDLSHVNFEMFCELDIPFEIFAALVALERFHPRICPNVTLQMTRRSASIVALVTLERKAFLQCASSSCALSIHQFEWTKTRTLCICEAFPQSGSFYASSNGLN